MQASSITGRHRDGPADDGLVPSRRIRRPLRVALVALIVHAALADVLLGYLWLSRLTANADRNAQIRDVVCALSVYATPPGSADSIRRDYRCANSPTRVEHRAAPAAPSMSTTARRHPSAHPSPAKPTRSRQAARTVPRKPATAGASQRVAGEHPAAGTTTPRKRRTATQGRAAASSTSRAPSKTATTSPGLLTQVCGLVGGVLHLC